MTHHTAKANLENGCSWPPEAIPYGLPYTMGLVLTQPISPTPWTRPQTPHSAKSPGPSDYLYQIRISSVDLIDSFDPVCVHRPFKRVSTMLPFSVSLLILVVILAMVVGKVSSQPTKLQVIIKESNKIGERPRNKDTVMLTKSRSACPQGSVCHPCGSMQHRSKE